MVKLTVKEQNLQQALDIIKMERFEFGTNTYHRLHNRISVGRTRR